MSIDEREKKELAKKIAEQRRSMWKGEATSKYRTKKKRKKTKPVLDRQQDREAIEQTPESPYQIAQERSEVGQALEEQQELEREELARKVKEQRRSVWKGDVTNRRRTKKKRERKKTKPVQELQSNRPKAKRQVKDVQSKIPSLKLALLVIIGLIAAILMGVAIGYLVAVHDLVKI